MLASFCHDLTEPNVTRLIPVRGIKIADFNKVQQTISLGKTIDSQAVGFPK